MSFRSRRRSLALLVTAVVLGSLAVVPALALSPSPVAGGTITVTATDHHFAGLPSSVPAGTSFRLVNAGAEVHQLLIARRDPGTTESWDDLIALPEDQLLSRITILDPIIAAPGTTAAGTVTVDQAGAYIALCFVPQGMTTLPTAGTTPDPALLEATPHVLLGMRQEFTVTAPGSTPGPIASDAPVTTPAAATRTIELDLTASLQITADGAQVKDIPVTPGETIAFKVTNTAGYSHNLYIGTDEQLSTAQVTDLPGVAEFSEGTQEFTWTVPADVTGLTFGCTVPGHFALMNGTFSIAG